MGHIADTIYNHSLVEQRIGLDEFYIEATQSHTKSTEAPYDDTEVVIHSVNGKEKQPKRPHAQCIACKTYGHEAKTWDQLAKSYWDNPGETVKVTEAFTQKYQPSNKATVHTLISEMKAFDKSNFESEQHAQWQDMFDQVNDSMAICRATIVPPTTVQYYLHNITALPYCQPVCEPDSTTDLLYSHPQALKTIQMSIPREYIMSDQEMLTPRVPIPRSPNDQPAITKMICTFPDFVAQGDSRANRALTNDRTLLTDFTPINPFPIGTIGPKLTMV